MSDLPHLGKLLVAAGIVIALFGGLLMLGGRLPIGRLPGDIRIHRDGFHFYFPLTTSILASAIFSLVAWLLSRWHGR